MKNKKEEPKQETLEQSNAMHKEEIEKTWIASAEYAILVLKDKTSKSSKEAFEQYYQQTYGND
jgi:hypothetical protein